jgi:hypothetical protein
MQTLRLLVVITMAFGIGAAFTNAITERPDSGTPERAAPEAFSGMFVASRVEAVSSLSRGRGAVKQALRRADRRYAADIKTLLDAAEVWSESSSADAGPVVHALNELRRDVARLRKAVSRVKGSRTTRRARSHVSDALEATNRGLMLLARGLASGLPTAASMVRAEEALGRADRSGRRADRLLKCGGSCSRLF